MRAEITIDGYNFAIDSVDPEILGKWFVEIFNRVGPLNNSSFVQFRGWPSYGYRNLDGSPNAGDWISNVTMNPVITGRKILTPRELVTAISEELEKVGL